MKHLGLLLTTPLVINCSPDPTGTEMTSAPASPTRTHERILHADLDSLNNSRIKLWQEGNNTHVTIHYDVLTGPYGPGCIVASDVDGTTGFEQLIWTSKPENGTLPTTAPQDYLRRTAAKGFYERMPLPIQSSLQEHPIWKEGGSLYFQQK